MHRCIHTHNRRHIHHCPTLITPISTVLIKHLRPLYLAASHTTHHLSHSILILTLTPHPTPSNSMTPQQPTSPTSTPAQSTSSTSSALSALFHTTALPFLLPQAPSPIQLSPHHSSTTASSPTQPTSQTMSSYQALHMRHFIPPCGTGSFGQLARISRVGAVRRTDFAWPSRRVG